MHAGTADFEGANISDHWVPICKWPSHVKVVSYKCGQRIENMNKKNNGNGIGSWLHDADWEQADHIAGIIEELEKSN